MDPNSARVLLRDLAARTLVAAYRETDGGRSLIPVDAVTGAPRQESEPAEVVRAVVQWHGAGWAGEQSSGWHHFVGERYYFEPGGESDLCAAVDRALGMIDDLDALEGDGRGW